MILVATNRFMTNPDKKPLLLWLQSSPGQSALFGQFLENGPLGINERGALYRRNHSLIANFNIIYLDQPAGSGYSFDKTNRYAATLEESSVQIISFLRRFLQIFPEYKNRQFFVAGESYGARSAIGVAHKMLTRQPQELPLRLKGAMLGAGFVFPLLEIINSTDYLYCSGLLDEQGRTRFARQLQKIQDFVDTGNFTAAAGLLCGTILNMHSVAEENLFEELTGFEHQGSIVRPLMAREIERYIEYANSTLFKRLVHIASSRILDVTRSQVEMTLAVGDFFTDKTAVLVEVLNKLHVLFYTAQLDALFPAKNIERSFEKLAWRGSAAFKTAMRRPWHEGNTPTNKLLGYEKTVGAVMYNTVLFAGHDISLDQSAAVSDMYGRFLNFIAMGPMNVSRHKCGTSEQFC
ncbi:probable serine carboxypeptidase CPVL [Dermacentor andersoni]|uniref:probable serine carboxypeptidase CPVL n=1 Tax=Dermacentor andersoni TaxID=34620 RepID=UPI002417677C|nr:probable serine carboxypeptidase CPVL [Dermacentor andersoni]